MAKNDRVLVRPLGSSPINNHANPEDMVLIYQPVFDSNGNYVIDSAKGVAVKRVGGVKSGSFGTVMGPSLKAPRTSFLEYGQFTASAGGADLIDIYPIQFDTYSGIGFVLGDCLKIM